MSNLEVIGGFVLLISVCYGLYWLGGMVGRWSINKDLDKD